MPPSVNVRLSTSVSVPVCVNVSHPGDGCGPSVLGPSSGTLSSLGYPGTYPNHTVCEWEIRVARDSRIHFRFADLDIEDANCQVNYLRLYNGIGPQRSEIGERGRGKGPKVVHGVPLYSK